MKRRRQLLIDGDVIAYKAAAALEEAVEWAPGYWTWSVNYDAVKSKTLQMIEKFEETLEAEASSFICLTDPNHNYRLDVLPSYKTHRKTVKKPLVLLYIKEWMAEQKNGVLVPTLEGDDVMGILATTPSNTDRIIVSIDKDMKTIPGRYVRTAAEVNEDGVVIKGAFEVQEITEAEADYNHLFQTLTGDVVDGYSGCPGIGPKKAEDILELEDTIADNWTRVVDAFAQKNLGEEEALVQARCARILRAEDYDFKRKEPILWTPKM